MRPQRRAGAYTCLAAISVIAVIAGLLVGVPAITAPAAVTAYPPEAKPARPAKPVQARGLTTGQAMARAKATRHGVKATALTSDRSQTTANPDGTLTLTQNLLPVRAFSGGRWQNLNATLRRAANSLTPAVTSSPVSLSPGGSGPLAAMTAAGRTLALYWPTPLPTPVIAGATATYRSVLPGVDLTVTADKLGGISDTLIIRSPAAAANPALAAIRLRAVASPGLHLTADAAGNLAVTSGGVPPFTAPPPLIWDSKPPPAGMHARTSTAGNLVSTHSGLPVSSSARTPGAGADVTPVPLTVSGDTITLTPPAAALNRPAADFPLYIDPSFHDAVAGNASNWTDVESGQANNSGDWMETSHDLQVGYCDTSLDPTCNNIDITRTFFTLPISSALTGAVITGSNLYVDNVVSDSCNAEPVELWTTAPFSSRFGWSNKPALQALVQSQSYAHGWNGCAPSVVGYTVTGVVQADAGHLTSQSFALKAGDETTMADWKQFATGASNITISTTYYFKPNQPANPQADGGCGTSSSPYVIGNDDVTLSATASDKDADPSLTTAFTVWDSSNVGRASFSSTTGEKAAASGLLTRQELEGWNTGVAVYHWSAVTKDENNQAGPVSVTCYFEWNPTGPAAPGVSVSPATQAIGQTVALTITPPPGCNPTTSPCPTSYLYQAGPAAPSTVTVGAGGCTTTSCPVSLTVSQLGPITVSVTGIANGNPGEPNASQIITGQKPSPPYADGHFTGGAYPDLLTTGTSATDPSLWLHPGTGNGTVGAPVDIGSLGTGINPGSDGPADWAGTQISHGNLTNQGVQDILAYYPPTSSNDAATPGTAVIIPGGGDAATLNSVSANTTQITPDVWFDSGFSTTPFIPSTVVAAGDASQTATGLDDLIAIYGQGSGYELELYTASGGNEGGYFPQQQLSVTAPDGTNDWNNYTLATAQPDHNPDEVVLLALDNATGAVYESVNPHCNPTDTSGCKQPASQTLVGMSGNPALGIPSTWSPALTVPWGTSAPGLVSADINSTSQVELWTISGSAAVPYTISGTTVSPGGSPSALNQASHDWPLTDRVGNCDVATPATALDTITGATATMYGTVDWGCDNTFNTDLKLDGTSTFVEAPPGIIPSTATGVSVSVWFKTTSVAAVLVSYNTSSLSGPNPPTSYDPLLYVGPYGTLGAGIPAGQLSSAAPVNDGLWHHAVLTVNGAFQTLTLDGVTQGTTSGTPSFAWATPGYLDFGAGYLGNGTNPPLTHDNGELADIQVSDQPASTFVPVTPVRIIDTRPGSDHIGPVTGPVASNTSITVPIQGNTTNGASIPPDATAAAVSITVTGQNAAGALAAYPSRTPLPPTSTLDFASTGDITNNAIVPVGPDGNIAIYNIDSGSPQILVDLTGYFIPSTDSGGSTYTPLPDPTRILDTRNGTGAPQAAIQSGHTLPLTIAGAAGIPASATAVAISLTVVPTVTGDHGFETIYPEGATLPLTSSLSYDATAGQSQAASVLIDVPVGQNGTIEIYHFSALGDAVNLLGDVSGYFTATTAGQYYHPLDSTRMFDTRLTSPPGIASHISLTLFTPASIPANPTLIINITVTAPADPGFLVAWPASQPMPANSIINFAAGETVANLALVNTATTDQFAIYNDSGGTVQVIVDTSGYFS